ncbi:uncharacterized protein NH340_JMT03945 [Sarcoptes scabiei]|nr:uncharacterized protein NH340_JMT03945 [Sarcoptes scabiei]
MNRIDWITAKSQRFAKCLNPKTDILKLAIRTLDQLLFSIANFTIASVLVHNEHRSRITRTTTRFPFIQFVLT